RTSLTLQMQDTDRCRANAARKGAEEPLAALALFCEFPQPLPDEGQNLADSWQGTRPPKNRLVWSHPRSSPAEQPDSSSRALSAYRLQVIVGEDATLPDCIFRNGFDRFAQSISVRELADVDAAPGCEVDVPPRPRIY